MIHFPTLLILIGYAIVWLELYVFPHAPGRTTPLAFVIAGLLFAIQGIRKAGVLRPWLADVRAELQAQPRYVRAMHAVAAALALVVIAVAIFSGTLPLHLLYEADALNYHYTLPRQHLILHHFAHLPWSTMDLFEMPIQFALTPYWFATLFPNKIPQLLITIGLWGLVARLASMWAPREYRYRAGFLALIAIVGSHGFAIQYGSGMMDLVLCYLGLATIDSVASGRMGWAGIEAALFFWAKFPTLYAVVGAAFVLGLYVARGLKMTPTWAFCLDAPFMPRHRTRMGVFFLLMSIVVMGPFVWKSLAAVGTPLFPFAAGYFTPWTADARQRLPAILQASRALWASVGKDRTLVGFLTHFVVLAVPTEGVNNPFDYPMGLPYLLFLVPFAAFTVRAVRRRACPALPLLVVILWAGWWMTSHQARFLYLPISLLFICGATEPGLIQARGLWCGLIVALGLTCLSVYHANKPDFGKSAWAVLRPEDQALIRLAGTLGPSRVPVELKDRDAAYATFPIHLSQGDPFFVIPQARPANDPRLPPPSS